MPIYEYFCPNGHRTEEWVATWREKQPETRCFSCNERAAYRPSAPLMWGPRLVWSQEEDDWVAGPGRAQPDAKEIWGDTSIGGTDGVNEWHRKDHPELYPDPKVTIDLGEG